MCVSLSLTSSSEDTTNSTTQISTTSSNDRLAQSERSILLKSFRKLEEEGRKQVIQRKRTQEIRRSFNQLLKAAEEKQKEEKKNKYYSNLQTNVSQPRSSIFVKLEQDGRKHMHKREVRKNLKRQESKKVKVNDDEQTTKSSQKTSRFSFKSILQTMEEIGREYERQNHSTRRNKTK